MSDTSRLIVVVGFLRRLLIVVQRGDLTLCEQKRRAWGPAPKESA